MLAATNSAPELKVGDFSVEFLGVEYPDYFGGYGLGPSSKYAYCTYGIGDTEGEALEDCLEMVAQQGFDFDEETEERLRAEYGTCDILTTAAEELGVDADSEETGWDDFPAYFHIGIKWNCRQEQRLERIRKIQNLEFLRYEDYQPIERDLDGYAKSWGYVTRADGDVSYGDLKETDCPESAVKYLEALSADDTESGEVYFYVPFTTGSDHSGSTVERSNYLSFIESYGEREWVFSAFGGFNTYAAVVSLTGLLGCDEDLFDEVCSTLEGLEDYPCIDESALSELETEGADEAWESWAAGDFTRAVEAKFADDAELELPSGDELRSFFEKKREEANEYWYNEGSGHDMYVGIDRVVEGIEFADVEQWAVCYQVSYNDGGEEREDYYLESEAIERVDSLRTAGFIGATYKIVSVGETE